MKNVISIFLLLPFALVAQEKIIEKTFDFNDNKEIKLNLQFADNIVIKSSNDNKIYFKAIVNINDGELNRAHQIDIDDDPFELDIDTDLDKDVLKKAEMIISDDDCEFYNRNDGFKVCAKINYEISIPENAQLKVESISGDIDIKGLHGPMKIKTISGFVDLSWDDSGADMKIKTITGEIYTDLDFDIDNWDRGSIVGSNIRARYKGGGTNVQLETISSDIFVRQE